MYDTQEGWFSLEDCKAAQAAHCLTLGACSAMDSTKVFTIPALMLKRSSRVMPGFLGTPAGITTKSAPFRAVAKSSFSYPVTCKRSHKTQQQHLVAAAWRSVDSCMCHCECGRGITTSSVQVLQQLVCFAFLISQGAAIP